MNSVFRAHMEAMRAHFKTHSRVAYPLPVALVGGPFDGTALPDAAKEVVAMQEGVQNEFYGEQQENVVGTTEELKQNHDQETFRARMNEQRERAKEKSEENIDRAFDQLIEIGEDSSPAAQEAILLAANALTTFCAKLLQQFLDWVTNFVARILEILKEAFEAIRSFFGGVADSVGRFFGGLFGDALRATG